MVIAAMVGAQSDDCRRRGRPCDRRPGALPIFNPIIIACVPTKHIAECWDISEALLISAMARCRLNDLVLKKAS